VNAYTVGFLCAGIVVLLAAWLPAYLDDRPMSMPIVLVGIGAAVFLAVPQLPDIDPREYPLATEHATEFAVLISLLGAGLALDRRPSWRGWSSTWRLLGIAMPLTIGAIFLAGWAAGLAPATALLFGAVIAPTDPVLAADVQVAEPTTEDVLVERAHEAADDGSQPIRQDEIEDQREDSGEDTSEDEVRFALTSEAGLNDGLAFPFVYAAVAVAASGGGGGWFVSWALDDLLLRVGIGFVVGLLAGRLLARILFDPPGPLVAIAERTQGFVAVGAILVTYGMTEVVHGYGFLAVFVAAVTLRHSRREHSYHGVMYEFTGQIEQLVSVALLVLLGGAVATGLLADLTWRGAIGAVAVVFVVRPLAGYLAMLRAGVSKVERQAISFFGIRGIGSIYYLAVGTQAATFSDADELWSATAFTILLSIVVHGVTATPIMRALDARRERRSSTATGTETTLAA
jgi:sodium/hydrogen antiporter